ncbi:integrase [Streptomyces sp. NPDC046976]|uniref:integrase n=1 Tax=Streptomyces sp. NPDC046976 TaxID=3155258 RepID=UPI0033DDB24D
MSVTLPWNDPTPPEMPVEASHRRPRAYNLLVTGREPKTINRNYFNCYVWKPAAGVIALLEEGNADSARVWAPSQGARLPRPASPLCLRRTEGWRIDRLPACWLGHSDPPFTLRKYSHFLLRAGARGSAAIDAIFAWP